MSTHMTAHMFTHREKKILTRNILLRNLLHTFVLVLYGIKKKKEEIPLALREPLRLPYDHLFWDFSNGGEGKKWNNLPKILGIQSRGNLSTSGLVCKWLYVEANEQLCAFIPWQKFPPGSKLS
jgi:hypothetical protein